MQQYKSLIMVMVLAGVMVVMAGVLLSTENMARKRQAEEVQSEVEIWTPLGGQQRLTPSEQLARDLDRLAILAELKNSPKAKNEMERILMHAARVTDAEGLPLLERALKRAGSETEFAAAVLTVVLLTELEVAQDLAIQEEAKRPGAVLKALNHIAEMAPASLRKISDPRLDAQLLVAIRAGKTLHPALLLALRPRLSPQQISDLQAAAKLDSAPLALRAFAKSIH